MDTERKQKYQRLLEEMSTRLSQDVNSLSEQSRTSSGGQGAGEITNVPQHLGDMGTDEFLHGMNNTLLENEEHVAKEVQSTQERLDDGTFGICDACGQAINDERLEAIPYTRYCAQCAERLEPMFVANYNSSRTGSPAETLSSERDAEQPGKA